MPAASLRVLLNDRCLRNPRTGVGRYVTELIARLPRQAPDIDLVPFYSRHFRRFDLQAKTQSEPEAHLSGVAQGEKPEARITRVGSGRFRWIMQGIYDAALEAYGSAAGFRLYHEPNHIAAPWHGPVLTTIHDLSVIRHPEWHPADRVQWYERQFQESLPRAWHFVAVSQFTRREMVELLGIDPQRITVIHEGVAEEFHPRPAEAVRTWAAEHGLPPAYLLYVGTIEPRKNVEGLVAACAKLPARLREGCPLMLAGMPGWAREDAAALAERHGLSGQVRPLGYVPDEDLAWLYCGARALVWPSFYEGFGLPPLEAMASGTPVIASDAGSLPEIVGDAGLLVNPLDVERIAEAVKAVLEQVSLAEALSQRGLNRARAFSWERFAADHAALYRRLGAESGVTV